MTQGTRTALREAGFLLVTFAVAMSSAAPAALAQGASISYDFTTDQDGDVVGSAGMLDVTVNGPSQLDFAYMNTGIPGDVGTNPAATAFGFDFSGLGGNNTDNCSPSGQSLSVPASSPTFYCLTNPGNLPGGPMNVPFNAGVTVNPNMMTPNGPNNGIPSGTTGTFSLDGFNADLSGFTDEELAEFINLVGVRYQGNSVPQEEGENRGSYLLLGEIKQDSVSPHNGIL